MSSKVFRFITAAHLVLHARMSSNFRGPQNTNHLVDGEVETIQTEEIIVQEVEEVQVDTLVCVRYLA